MNLSSSLVSLLKYSNAKVLFIEGLSVDERYLSIIGLGYLILLSYSLYYYTV